jgi:hypothetical protein
LNAFPFKVAHHLDPETNAQKNLTISRNFTCEWI